VPAEDGVGGDDQGQLPQRWRGSGRRLGWPVTTSVGGAPATVSARWRNARAAAVSRFAETYTLMTCPCWSAARYTYRRTPPTLTYVSSKYQQFPTGRRDGRAVSASSGTNRCTHRWMVTWSTSTPRSASSSSTSRYDNPNRRYQRTARTITSGGNRKPANDEHDAGGRRVGLPKRIDQRCQAALNPYATPRHLLVAARGRGAEPASFRLTALVRSTPCPRTRTPRRRHR
jgi:hypothetical protein